MKITHWVPGDKDPRSWASVESWINTELPRGAIRRFVRSASGNRKDLPDWNRVTREILESGDDWLFSTHMDVQYVPQTLKRLLSWDKPLVAALVFMRQSPVVPHIWKSYEDQEVMAQRIKDTRNWFFDRKDYIKFGPFIMEPRPADALAQVDFTSTACALIHRSVIAKVEPPWWEMHDDNGGGEDAKFYVKANNAGFEAFVDRSCIAGHLVGDIPTSSMDFIMWSQASDYRETGEPGTEMKT